MEPHPVPTAPPSAGHSPLVAVEWDAEGRVVRWPAEAEALFGWRADEVLGKSPEEWPFVHADDREAVRRATRKLVRGAIRQNLSINRNLTRDGRTIHCEWYNTAVVDGAGKLAAQLSLVLDVTARERAFAEMQAARAAAERAAERTRGLQWVTAALSEALTPPAVTRVVVEQAISLLGAASAVVVLLDASGEWLDLVGHEGYSPEVLADWRTFSRLAPVPLADSVRTGAPVVLRSLEERAAHYPALAGTSGYPAILSVPLTVEGEVLGALGLGFAHEQALGDEEVALAMALARQCAQAVRRANLLHAEREARREVESLGERLRLALASADVGTWDFDPVSGALSWDCRCRTIMGLPGDAPVDYAAFRAALHPDDRDRIDEAVEAALDPRGTGEFGAEYRTVGADGEVRWALSRGRAFFNGEGSERRAVRFIGTIIDNTQRNAAEAERERLVAQLRTERERLAEVFARAPVSIAVMRGTELRIELANELALTFGNRRDVVGRTVREAFPELEEQGFFELLDAVRATGRPFHGRDLPIRFAHDGEVRNAFFDVTCHPLLDSEGGVEGIITLHFDVTERVRARRRMELLAEAGTALALSSDPAGVLRALARIAAARLAGGCAVFLAAAHGAPGQSEAAIRGGGEVRFHDVPPPEALGANHPVSRVLLTGHAERLETGDGIAALFGEGNWAGGAVVPMRMDGRTIGAVVLASGAGDEWGAEELMMAEELVRRAALAGERARLYERALAANLAKSQFLATMSHEIRTPINAVMGYAELLEIGVAGPLNPQQDGYVERIRYSSHHLLGLINDILDLAKVEAGELRFAREPVPAEEAMASVVAMVIPQAEAKGVRLAAEACAPAAELLGDGDRVRQVLLNLVSNAVKFTNPGGRVTVRCGTADAPPPGTLLPGAGPWGFVEVADTGIGVPREELDRIFDPFTQVDGTHTREQGGTGLGLAISRTFARRMGGEVAAWSRPGEGSVFTLWLPAVQEAAATSPAPAAPRPVPGLASVGRVLEERVEEVLAAWTQRIGREPALPHARGVEWVQLEDHAATFLVEVARSLMALDAGGGEPALVRDGENIIRTVARLHGAQRARLGFTEQELRLEYRILFEEAERLLRHHIGALTDADPGPALAVVRRVVDDAAEVAMQGHTAPADAIVAEAHRVIGPRETVRRLRAQVGGRKRKRPRGEGGS